MTFLSVHSLRLRLILAAAFAVILAMVISGLFIADHYRTHTTARFKSELDHHLDELVMMIIKSPDGQLAISQPLSDPLFNIPSSGLYWQIEKAGTLLLRSPSLGTNILDTSHLDEEWHAHTTEGEPTLQRSMNITLADGQEKTVTIASAVHLLEDQIAAFYRDLTVYIIVIGILLLLGAAGLVQFGLAPVRRLEDEVERLRNGETDRLSPEAPAEFVPLVERLNAVLDGQAQIITRARTESGNLAHHLRTPLALIADEAEQLRLKGLEESADFLQARCDSMRRHIDYHLARAAAAGTRGAGTLTKVEPLLTQIVDAMKRLHADRNLDIRISIPAKTKLLCDPGDLAEILSNLIDNACKWADSRVIISGNGQYIEVRDDGPGIPEDKRKEAVSIGTRLDPDKPGMGLGLAASRDLLSFYDAQMTLSDAPEGGLMVKIDFPPIARAN